ncbi:YqaA family protein [Dokdonella sp.]|uniref:YqaA family protein n=1 Tax=Dokdonella sp. TaxID=2291710 RepID=UPI0031C7602A|nr:VTT domain-containing protein [Dokdonella sp.]
MKLFAPLYERAIRWAAHPRANPYLGLLSFVEAIIFPVAPEVMLAPMVLARPRRWWQIASISLLGSLLGALVGYALGHYAFHALRPLLDHLGWLPRIDALVMQLEEDVARHPWNAFIALVIAGFMPVPLKIFTWASGIVGVPMPAFMAAMFVGRGKRVYLLAGLIRLGGERAEHALHRWIEWIGWAVVALLIAAVLYFVLVH